MKKMAVIDLDGCLCSINTFRYWLLFSSFYLLLTFRWLSLFKFLKCIIFRVAGLTGRVEMKRSILSVTEGLPRHFVRFYCFFLKFFINQSVLREIDRYVDDGVDTVLCTAASWCYADVLASYFRFSHVFSTPSVFISQWYENFGEAKLNSIVSYYGSDVDLVCVITDHSDDLPLLLKAKRCVLVSPSSSTLSAISGRIDFDKI